MKNLRQEMNRVNQMSIGFDRIFNELFVSNRQEPQPFPKYNIIKDSDNEFRLVLALAGYSQDDLDISYCNRLLTIESDLKQKDDKKEDEFIYQGIAKRNFKFRMPLSEFMEIKDATMRDGLLTISLENIIPEEKKARKININS